MREKGLNCTTPLLGNALRGDGGGDSGDVCSEVGGHEGGGGNDVAKTDCWTSSNLAGRAS